MSRRNKKVFVAMSGGVDSSVAAALLKEQGYEVVGVTMCFSVTEVQTRRPSCCGLEGIEDARTAARILNIPHYVLDFKEDLQRFIVDDFVHEYLNGRTPNPCVRCNQFLKFETLLRKVIALGADYLATGHYARLEFDKRRNHFSLKKAKDTSKDQSYFLYGIQTEAMERILFPLGCLLKEEVRDLAKKAGLNTAQKPESQDICFVSDSGYEEFIKARLDGKGFSPGNFLNQRGEVVGQHQGIMHYTIGQRQKLGIALGVPVYVTKIDKDRNTVHVGPKEYLLASGLKVRKFLFLRDVSCKEDVVVSVRIRYNAPEVKAKLIKFDGNRVEILFAEPQYSVTPGQSVVAYDGEDVLGGGIIEEAITNR